MWDDPMMETAIEAHRDGIERPTRKRYTFDVVYPNGRVVRNEVWAGHLGIAQDKARVVIQDIGMGTTVRNLREAR